MATLHERQLLRGTAAIAAVAGTLVFPVGCRTGGAPARPAAPALASAADGPDTRADRGDPVDLAEVDTPPTVVERVAVRVPDPRRGGTSGQVGVRALINERGTVEEVEVLPGPPTLREFSEEVVRAVLQWRFEPAIKDGAPVRVWYTLDVTISWR